MPIVPLPTPVDIEEARALDSTIFDCDAATGFTTFSETVEDVQADGGGSITYGCSGTITFTSELTITTPLTIFGNGIVFDGGGTTRLFQVDSGATLALEGLTVRNGSTSYNGEGGGARFNQGTLTVTASTFSDNRTSGAESHGGAIANSGMLTVTDSIFSNNSTSGLGADSGAIDNNGGTLVISRSTFINNSTSGVDGDGGAVFNFVGTVTIVDSTFSNNGTSGEDTRGGAVANVSGTMTIHSSTINNSSVSGIDSDGGAIFDIQGQLTISASTINGNISARAGAALYVGELSSATITASTISDNTSSGSQGSIVVLGTLTIAASIVANNSPANCLIGGGGSITSNGSNLSNEGSCGFTATGDIENSTSINLGPLADNGGPTLTMLPQADSDAIGNADCTLSSAEDQRGVTRPTAGTICTIGAVEVTVLCVSRSTGALSAPGDDGCGPRERALVLPGEEPVTLCIRRGTGAVSVRDGCPSSWDQHVVPDDGPFEYCVSRHTGALRAMPASGCASNERPGAIPA